MSRIIAINNQVASIALDDGGKSDVNLEDLPFKPYVGQEVDVVESGSYVIVIPRQIQQSQRSQQPQHAQPTQHHQEEPLQATYYQEWSDHQRRVDQHSNRTHYKQQPYQQAYPEHEQRSAQQSAYQQVGQTVVNGDVNIVMANNNTKLPAKHPVYVNGKVVNKLGYSLLAFFFGGLGAHKFYAGKTSAGIAYLLFCWTGIPSILGIVEGIVGLTKPSDSNGDIVV